MDGVSVEGQRVHSGAPAGPKASGRTSTGPGGQAQTPVRWSAMGLPTMASMPVGSLARASSRSFTARCQWPRLHPLNERAAEVRHHPLIMVESARRLALAVERLHLLGGDTPFEPASISLGLRPCTQPQEQGGATEVEAVLVLSDLAPPRTGSRPTGPSPSSGTGAQPSRRARCAWLVPPAAGDVLDAGRQATLLRSGRTADAVVGLCVDLRAPVPSCGAAVEVETEATGSRFLVTAAHRTVATGSVMLAGP
ncbi:hypothetical protein EOT10_39450 [Streptomyces antnestii]|uniref:A-factor biosynthesis hotdog domain-containing protein n=1 Tax=Streptomyces antnestii TaxID=2494256 RepID=A0A3S2YMZ0_9ACTN|nr:hypothetical protein [Streptomyces sp. San01]RVU15246.1 hypothetical protein EOT10_39450 [Streptomyces sp. San01]